MNISTQKLVLAPALLALAIISGNTAGATQRFVNLINSSPTPPYTSWATAATNIQNAINAATNGDEVVVSNGVYQTGATAVYGMSNRVAVTKPLFVHSVNGPAVTIIQGYQVPVTTNGDAAVRCAYLTNGAVLAGFTLTNGATQTSGDFARQQSGGGIWCESVSAVVSNCVAIGNSAFANGGGTYNGTFYDSTLTGNTAGTGGGACIGTFSNCTVSANTALSSGGGTYLASLYNCTLNGNLAITNVGGGVYGGYLENCVLTNNYAADGGGAFFSAPAAGVLYNCLITDNSALLYGGGVCIEVFADYSSGVLYNCVLSNNSADSGGGACQFFNADDPLPTQQNGALFNCTLMGNLANLGGGLSSVFFCPGGVCNESGGGIAIPSSPLPQSPNTGASIIYGAVINCIIYHNLALDGDNFYNDAPLNYCCTTPMPVNGIGNFTNAPGFVSLVPGNLRLQTNSPCINAGDNDFVSTSTDMDGNPRIIGGTVDVGAYEFLTPASFISYAWLLQYGLPTDGSADFADPDHDGMKNWQEWVAGTVPTNAASVLRMKPPVVSSPGLLVSWTSVSNHTYSLLRATNLTPPTAFSVISSNIFGLEPITSLMDTNATGSGPYFYRVQVEEGPVIGPGDCGNDPSCILGGG